MWFGCENFGTVGEDPITAAQQGRRVFCFQLLCLQWFQYSTWNSGKEIKMFGVCHPERWSSGNPLREDSWGGGSVLWQGGELPPWSSAELVIIGCSKAMDLPYTRDCKTCDNFHLCPGDFKVSFLELLILFNGKICEFFTGKLFLLFWFSEILLLHVIPNMS